MGKWYDVRDLAGNQDFMYLEVSQVKELRSRGWKVRSLTPKEYYYWNNKGYLTYKPKGNVY